MQTKAKKQAKNSVKQTTVTPPSKPSNEIIVNTEEKVEVRPLQDKGSCPKNETVTPLSKPSHEIIVNTEEKVAVRPLPDKGSCSKNEKFDNSTTPNVEKAKKKLNDKYPATDIAEPTPSLSITSPAPTKSQRIAVDTIIDMQTQTQTVLFGTHVCVCQSPAKMALPWTSSAINPLTLSTLASSSPVQPAEAISHSTLSALAPPFVMRTPVSVPKSVEKTSPAQPAWGGKKLFSELLKKDVSPSVSGTLRPTPIITTQSAPNPNSRRSSPSPSPSKSKRGDEIKKFNDALKEFDANLRINKLPTVPRGLINTGNMCYNNAILQMLAECGPLYNLIMEIGQSVPNAGREAPLIEAMITYMRQIDISKPNSVKKSDAPILCERIFEVLRRSKKVDFMKGRQEDAEEFLGHVLDNLHEEMVNVSKVATKIELDESSDEQSRPSSPESANWLEVGPKNKVAVTRTLSTDDTPITKIFGGKIRSILKATGQKDSVTVEPFRSLQLDISVDNVNSIEDAISNLAKSEVIENYTVKNVQVPAQKQMLIEELPPVLVLQLKRFRYSSTEGTEKIMKGISYPETIKFPEHVLAHKRPESPNYTLTSVIYHHGSSLDAGHYTARVRSQNEWLNFDDEAVTPGCLDINQEDAYLLVYTKTCSAAKAPIFQSTCHPRGDGWKKIHKH